MLSNQAFWLNHQGAAAYQRDLDALTEQISTWAELPAQGATCTIVLRRSPKMSVSLSKFKVFLDDEKIGEISNDQSRKFEIAPGTHALYLESGSPMLGRLSQSASDKLSFTIRHGETKRFTCSANALRKYYIELSAEE
jgi:hypothetical protein